MVQPGLLQPDRRRGDRLVGAALRRERDPGRRADEDRLAARVDPERPRLQRPFDERVVEHPDRQQRLAPPPPGRAELAEQPDEVRSRRCPSSRCWPPGRSRQCRIVSGSSANQSTRSRADHTPTLFTQPPRFVDDETSGHSVTTRAAASGAERVRSSRARPSAAWVVACPPGVRPMSVGSSTARGGRHGVAASRRAAAAHSRACGGRREAAPTGCPVDARAARPARPSVRAVSSEEWFCGWPSRGQAVALDRVGEDHRRAGVVDGGEGLAERARSWPPRLRIAACRLSSSSDGRPAATATLRAVAGQPLPQLRRRCSAAAAGTPGWASRRSAAAARRRRGGRTAPAAAGRT